MLLIANNEEDDFNKKKDDGLSDEDKFKYLNSLLDLSNKNLCYNITDKFSTIIDDIIKNTFILEDLTVYYENELYFMNKNEEATEITKDFSFDRKGIDEMVVRFKKIYSKRTDKLMRENKSIDHIINYYQDYLTKEDINIFLVKYVLEYGDSNLKEVEDLINKDNINILEKSTISNILNPLLFFEKICYSSLIYLESLEKIIKNESLKIKGI